MWSGITPEERQKARQALNVLRLLEFTVGANPVLRGESVRLTWRISEPSLDTTADFAAFLLGGGVRRPLPDFAGELDLQPARTADYRIEVVALLFPSATSSADPPLPPEEIRRTLPNTLRVTVADPPPSIPNLTLFGWEVNQGLTGYNLVAGKDTLVRVFVGAAFDGLGSPPNIMQPIVQAPGRFVPELRPLFHPDSTLEYALLRITTPSGTTFDLGGSMASGTFSNRVQNFSENDNVNFYVPGRQLSEVGSYRFVTHWFRAGAEISTVDLGSAFFNRTRDLRLLIVVERYPMSWRGWQAIQTSLDLLNRSLPIRSGVGPMDGDLRLGLRVKIIPLLLDTPLAGMILDQVFLEDQLADFNVKQARQGLSDRADKILTVRLQQPNEPMRTGIGGGNVASVVLNVDPSRFLAPFGGVPGESYFGFVVGQEVCHTFGASFVNPPNPHSPNLSIVDRSAFDLLNRRSITNPIPLMGFVDIDSNERAFLEPIDWNNILNQINALDSTGPD